MNHTKLKQLEKDDLLSEWQKQQRAKNFRNDNLFLQMKASDPWMIERREKSVLETHIPGLKSLKSSKWGPRHRSNKDINQQLKNQRMMASRENFYKTVNIPM